MTHFLYAKIVFVFIVVYSETIFSYRAQQLDLDEGKIVLITFTIIFTRTRFRILTDNRLHLNVFILIRLPTVKTSKNEILFFRILIRFFQSIT